MFELKPPHSPLLEVITIKRGFLISLFSNSGLDSDESKEADMLFINSESLLEYGLSLIHISEPTRR